jgi:hypothetical protein
MTRRYMEDPTSDGDVVEPDRYTVQVVDARALEDKDFVWLDLRIVGGPDDGRVVSCSLNMPDDNASRGAKFYFKKKVRGFLPFLTEVWMLPDEEQAEALAEAVLDKRVDAILSIQKDGPYKGSQQLDETFEADVQVAPPTLQAAPAPAPENNGAPAQEQPVAVNTDPPF